MSTGDQAAPSATPSATPTRRIVTERRERPLRAGIGLAAAALVLLVLGGVLTFAAQALEVSTGERAFVGNPVTFDANDGEYTVLLLTSPIVADSTLDGLTADLLCDVTDASGSIRTVDHRDLSGSRASTDVGVVVARVDLAAGATTVACDWRPGTPSFDLAYAVGESRRSLDVIGLVLVGVGLVAGLIAAWLIVIGVRGRQVTRPLSTV
jgi:hypothetical protein